MKLSLNKEYARRHLFVAVILAALAAWFGYDGFVRYPALPAADLYRLIEQSDPPAGLDLGAFKRQKTQAQLGLAAIMLLGALVVGIRLGRAAAFAFEFDDDGFVHAGRRYARADIAAVDRRRWESKSILVLRMKDGSRIVLDAWHHVGVKDFAARHLAEA